MAAMFARYPLLKTILPGTFAIAAGDMTCQAFEGHNYDPLRTGKMALTGLVLVTPASAYINKGIHRILPGNSFEVVMKKASLSASMVIVGIIGSFSGNAFLSNRSVGSLSTQLDHQLPLCFSGALAFWIPANVYLLKHVPKTVGKLGAAFLAQTVWSVYMSRALNAKIPEMSSPGKYHHNHSIIRMTNNNQHRGGIVGKTRI